MCAPQTCRSFRIWLANERKRYQSSLKGWILVSVFDHFVEFSTALEVLVALFLVNEVDSARLILAVVFA